MSDEADKDRRHSSLQTSSVEQVSIVHQRPAPLTLLSAVTSPCSLGDRRRPRETREMRAIVPKYLIAGSMPCTNGCWKISSGELADQDP
ncbi:unnamed protein product [Zymoseptoria tritici ST99CH_1A5]|uniref:Uncharacterized protein n=2 Tax=Zymoseptoria tritici TaxID=1047171 RepID=A0A2H1FX87_ZYMTR|nr:unnamed protein product [Zymoseptoria tritici ST99CH_1E4]SMY21074.1 unnamed protein product [Zymoseptoria tritici ST99CH_1A5]